MPELPEVETILRGIAPYVENQHVKAVIIRQSQLRWRIPSKLAKKLTNQVILKVSRRGKYLLFHTKSGTAILHFGMSGSVSILPQNPSAPQKHDHFDIIFNKFCLRYTDPRRFGAFLWTDHDPLLQPLLCHLGPEPLEKEFTGEYLYLKAKNRNIAIKQFIMNSTIVVGVGNIYAAEALFLAKINPFTAAKTVSLPQYQILCKMIKKVLTAAIRRGGTTLRDFVNTTGKPGYFKQELNVYGREGLECKCCKNILVNTRLQNRATVYCVKCQPLY